MVFGAFFEDLSEKRAFVDLLVHAEGAKRDAQKASVRHQICGGFHLSDFLSEIVDVALNFRLSVENGALRRLGRHKKAKAGEAGGGNDRGEAHCAAPSVRRAASTGISV